MVKSYKKDDNKGLLDQKQRRVVLQLRDQQSFIKTYPITN